MKHRISWKETTLFLLPVLFFILWAWFTSEQDLRTHLSGKWKTETGNLLEFRVHGNDLEVWQNGRKDPKSTYHFIGHNMIQFTDYHRKQPLRIPIYMRIRRGVLESQIGNETSRAYRVEELSE